MELLEGEVFNNSQLRDKLKEAIDKGVIPAELIKAEIVPTAAAPKTKPQKAQPTLSRQQRRERERNAKRYDSRQTFTKKEVEDMNAHAFKLGTGMALYAAKKVLGLGDVRLDRVRKEILLLEDQFIMGESLDPLPFDTYEINQYKGAK